METGRNGPPSLLPGFLAHTNGDGDTTFWSATGSTPVRRIEPHLLTALLRLLAQKPTREQIYASLSRFPPAQVDDALQKLADAGVVTDELAPLARAFHMAATRALTPGQRTSVDALHAMELAQGEDEWLTVDRKAVFLPEEPSPNVSDLWATIRARRTIRQFAARPVALQDLADILALATGVTDTTRAVKPLRAAPSGGALYPINLYVAALRVDGMDPAVYRHHPLSNNLELLHDGISPGRLSTVVHTDGQPSVETCAAVLLMTWSWTRSLWKYGEKGYFLGLIEAGHIGQNALLAATRLGLAAAPTVGLGGDAADAFLRLDPREEQAIYAIILGHPPELAARGHDGGG